MYVCVCMYVCLYVCMYVCMYVSMYVYVYDVGANIAKNANTEHTAIKGMHPTRGASSMYCERLKAR